VKIKESKAVLNPTPTPKRIDVLMALWTRAQWLNNRISDVDCEKRQVTPKLKQLVYMTQVHSQLCKTILYGLKDEELELRINELETQLKDGILIPKPKEPKTK